MSLTLILFKAEPTFEDIEVLMAISAIEITSTAYVSDRSPVPAFEHGGTGHSTAVVFDLSFPDHDVVGVEPELTGKLKALVTQNFRESVRKLQPVGA
jgi:hypothetical protein